MSGSKFFSGPPSNKATASTVAAAVATLFWTIAAHTFWKTMSTADLSLYIATSTVIVTAVIGFAVPESAAFTVHNANRLVAQGSTASGSVAAPVAAPSVATLEAKIQGIQDVQNAMAAHLGFTATPAITTPRQ